MSNKTPPFSFRSLFIPFTTLKAAHFMLLIGLVVYFNSLLNGFFGDDNSQIVNNPAIHSLSNIPLFFKGSTMYLEQIQSIVGVYYRPLLSTSYTLLYLLFGENAFFFHLFQLLLHITNSFLIYLIFKKHFRKSVSYILALMFLLHPINNEAIVYLANLQEELFTFFGLLSLIILLKGKSFIIVSALLLMCMLSKETGILFIPFAITYYVLYLNKQQNRLKHLLLYLLCILMFYLVLRIFVAHIGFRTELLYMTENATLLQRIFSIPSIILYYLKMTVFPYSIAFAWYWVVKNPNFNNFVLPLFIDLLVLAALLTPAYTLRSKIILRHTYFFFFLMFVLSFSSSLQIVPLYSTVADRWFYVPLIGLLGVVGATYEGCFKKITNNKLPNTVVAILLVFIILCFSVRDIMRNFDFKDSFTICKHDAQVNTNSYLLEYCLGNEYFIRKEYGQAKIHALKAVDLYPQYFFSWYTLGQIYFDEKDLPNAQKSFEKTLELNNFAYGGGELALTYVYQDKTKEAKDTIQKYMKLSPRSAKLWYALALCEYKSGNKDKALSAAKQAYTLNPTPLTYKVYYRLSHDMPLTF